MTRGNKKDAIRNFIRRRFNVWNEKDTTWMISEESFNAGVEWVLNPDKFNQEYQNIFSQNDIDEIAP